MPAAAIAVVALAVRLLHLWQIRAAPFFTVLMGDARAYDAWAQRIAGGDWIGGEVFYQAPLYPYLLGVVYAVGGRDLMTVRVCQALIGSAACVLLALAARRVFSRKAGIVAGLALALYAPAIFFDSLLQKTVLDVFFICLVLWVLSHLVDEPRRRWWLLLGLAMGGLSLTRENALVLVAVVLAWIGLSRAGWSAAAAFVLGLALLLAPVVVRNAAVGGGYYLTTSQFGPNLFIGNNPRSDGTYASLRPGRGAPEYERHDATELAEHALGRRLTPGEVSGYWTDRAVGFMTSQPGAWLKLAGRKLALLWNAGEMLDTESQETYAEWSVPLRAGAWVGHFGVLVPLAVLGVWVTWPDRRRLAIFYATTLAYAGSVVLFYVFARYRFPLVPMLILFASPGLVAAAGWLRGRERPASLLAPAALVAAVAVCANWPLLSAPMMQAITENNLATALQSEGGLDAAIAHYERAIALRPDYAPAYNNLGTALRSKGRVDEAVAAYRQALERLPDYPDAHFNLGNALLEKDQRAEAVEHFRVALQALPGSPDTHNNLGIALAGSGRVDDAIDQFRRALEADPQSVMAHRNLAGVLADQGRVEEAVVHLRRAIELAPADPQIRYDLGVVLLDAQQPREAAIEFRKALDVDDGLAKAHNNLGVALASQGDIAGAVTHFQRALEIQPDFPDARRNLAMARGARGGAKP